MSSTYNINHSYDQNYADGPQYDGLYPNLAALNHGLRPVEFLGHKLHSTLGIPAGPLLNSAYIKLYADLGWDVLTYKTVRTGRFPSHPFPNVRAVTAEPEWMLAGNNQKPTLYTRPDDSGPLDQLSITNSFGMPSRDPAIWQEDIARAKAALHPGQLLVVSVVGSAKAGGTLTDLVQDFALAAQLAAEAGAQAVEANLSCPNVKSGEGSLYQSAEAVRIVASAIAASLRGQVPFLLKMGYLADQSHVQSVVQAAAESGASGLAAINTIPANVLDAAGQQALPGDGRLVSGICGAAIKPAGLAMVRRLLTARAALNLNPRDFVIVGVGGVMTAADCLEYLATGADGVQSGTGAMWHPGLAQEYKQLVTAGLAAV